MNIYTRYKCKQNKKLDVHQVPIHKKCTWDYKNENMIYSYNKYKLKKRIPFPSNR